MPRVLLLALLLFAQATLGADLDALTRQLSDRDPQVRENAARDLWDMGKAAEPARSQLLVALEDPNPDVVAAAAGALQALGMKEQDLVAPRKRVFASPNASLSSRFFVSRNLIGQVPSAQIVDVMVAYLERVSSSQMGSRQHNIELAQKGLARMAATPDRPLIAPRLARLLDNPDAKVRRATLLTLRDYNREDEVPAWRSRAASLVRDPDESVRVEALWALGSAAGLASSEIGVVAAALGDPEASVRRAAAQAIGEIGEKGQAITATEKLRVAEASRAPLAKLAEGDSDEEVRYEAKGALAKLAAAPTGNAPVAPVAAGEAGGLATLRARKVAFDEPAFFQALTNVDAALIDAFLAAGMPPNKPVMGMGPPLRVMLFGPTACSADVRPTSAETKAAIGRLLARGADPNVADGAGNTALMEAASHGCDREVMKLLIKAGAKVDTKSKTGMTAFELGLYQGHDGLDELIAAGYRLPPEKAKVYAQAYANSPAAQAMIRKATKK